MAKKHGGNFELSGTLLDSMGTEMFRTCQSDAPLGVVKIAQPSNSN